MAEPINTQGCPFCRAEVVLEGRTLRHAAPVCSEYRAWMDKGKQQHRAAAAEGRANELLAAHEQIEREQTDPGWAQLMMEVGTVGLHRATAEQLTRWSDDLERLGAPYLATAIRKEIDERAATEAAAARVASRPTTCSHGVERSDCIVKCDACGHACSAHLPTAGCVEMVDEDDQCDCEAFED